VRGNCGTPVRNCMANSSTMKKIWCSALQAGDLAGVESSIDRYKMSFTGWPIASWETRKTPRKCCKIHSCGVYQKIGSFEGKSKLSTWLYRILRESVSQSSRGLKKFVLTKPHDPAVIMGFKPYLSPQDTAAEYEAAELQQQIARAVASLKPDQRAMCRYIIFRVFPARRSAEILEKPLGTIKTHLFRARNKLKKNAGGIATRSGEIIVMSCENIQSLFAPYLNGKLDGEQRQRVEQHLATCLDCQSELSFDRKLFASLTARS